MRVQESKAFWVQIHLSGPLHRIEDACRSYCLGVGLCVTVTPTKFIYTGGEESGAVVRLINYPKFPTTPEVLLCTAIGLADALLVATYQHSVLIETPERIMWKTNRE